MKFTQLSKTMRRLITNILLFPVFLGFAIEGDGGDGGDGGNDGGDAGGDTGGDDLSTLFTPEEVEGKRAAIEASKAEESRREALSDDERAAEDAAKAEADKKNVVPEKYEAFKIPEGMEFDTEVMTEFEPVLKDLGLSQDKAQQLMDFFTSKVVPSWALKGSEVWNADIQKRQGEIQADKEIGGDKLKVTTETVNRVVNTFLSAEESVALKEYSSRFGDCPAFIKILARVGAAMKEDTLVMPGAGGQGEGKSLADRIYDKKD